MTEHIVDALIEIPLGSKNKYEIDKATGRIKLDRDGRAASGILRRKKAYPVFRQKATNKKPQRLSNLCGNKRNGLYYVEI